MSSKIISRYTSARSAPNGIQTPSSHHSFDEPNRRLHKRSEKRRWLKMLLCGASLAAASLGSTPSLVQADPPTPVIFNVTDSATFQHALSHAHSGDVINIISDFTMTQSVGAINADLTIHGNGHTIDGGDLYRPFFIESGTVAIADLTIENGRATGGTGGAGYRGGGGGMGAGGAIFVNSGAALTLSDVDFVSNEARGGNGMASTVADGGGGGGGMDQNGFTRTIGSDIGANGGGANGGDGGVAVTGSDGGDFGGGGGAAYEPASGGPYNGGAGGFGGGGGGAGGNGDGSVGEGGNGGFGGGGGGGSGSGGFGGGNGSAFGGGGGAGFGGAVFVREGGSVTIQGGSFSGGVTQGGSGSSGASSGSAAGSGIFLNHVTANFNIADGESMTIDDAIGGNSGGSIGKQGTGTLVLNGANTFTGNSDIDAGLLVVNGSMAGAITVWDDAALGGTGTLENLVEVYGRLAPGNSIGTLNFDHSLYLNHGSVTEIEIQPSANPVAGTDNDLIVVNQDALIFGGSVDVKAAPGSYVDGARYTFLTADFIFGGYDTITDDLAFFDFELGRTMTEYYFTLVAVAPDFRDLGRTGNQRAVGAALDANVAGASGDFQNLLSAFQPLTHGQAQNALSQLSGEVHGSGSQVMVNGTNQMLGTIGQQLRGSMSQSQGTPGAVARYSTRRSTRHSDSAIALVSYNPSGSTCDEWAASTCRDTYAWRAWTLGYGLGGSADSDGNAAGIHYGLGGTTTGIERFVSDYTRVGAFGGYVGSQVTTDGIDQTSEANGGNFGAYLTHDSGLRYGMLIGGIQFDDYESQRTIQVGGLTRTAVGESDGWQGFVYGEQGLNLNLSHGVNLQPFTGLQYVYARQNAFTETGAGAMNLDVSGIDTNSLRSMLGSRLQFQSRSARNGWIVTPEVRGLWMHEFLDTTSIVNAQFAGVGGAGFTANGLDLGRDWAILGTGLAARPSDRWELRADYNSQFNDRQALHIGSGTVSYWW